MKVEKNSIIIIVKTAVMLAAMWCLGTDKPEIKRCHSLKYCIVAFFPIRTAYSP